MSEQSPHNKELSAGNKGEYLLSAGEQLTKELNAEKLRKSNEAEGDAAGKAEQIRSRVETYAIKTDKLSSNVEQTPASHHPAVVGKEIKKTAMNRTLVRIHKRESLPARTFSKVIHNEAVERASEAVGNTVARPSGMVGGAFVSLVGTSLLLWLTRHYGYEYNYLMVIIFFGVGMAIGLGIEAFYKMKKASQ